MERGIERGPNDLNSFMSFEFGYFFSSIFYDHVNQETISRFYRAVSLYFTIIQIHQGNNLLSAIQLARRRSCLYPLGWVPAPLHASSLGMPRELHSWFLMVVKKR
jgi:hypothetical protein